MFRTLQGRPPLRPLPAGAVDTHIHIIDTARFPHHPDGPPPPPDATVQDYEKVMGWLGIDRVVITQSNTYNFDNRCLMDALDQFGDRARGVVAVDADVSDAALDEMTAKGVRGARIMNLLQGAAGLGRMLDINARVRPFGMSLIVQFDGREILHHLPALEQIRGDYVIDHTGKFLDPVAPDSPEFKALLGLVDRGNCYVKLAGCYETSKSGAPGFEDLGALSRAVIAHAPDRVIWGSNWPHNMATSAETYPDDVALLDLVMDWAGSEENTQKIFVDNATRLYGF